MLKFLTETAMGRAIAICLLVSVLAQAQGYPRGRRPATSPAPLGGSYKGVLVTFHGKMKQLDKKQITIETEEKQLVTLRITSKTKFLNDGKTIKPSMIDTEAPVTIDATEDTDLSVMAINISVDPQNVKAK